jgi:hypothetical protein
MANIFLSYAREDLVRARSIASALESQGWSVFWDRHIPHGQDFNSYIQSQLDEARCIIVLWSRASVASAFVRDEASEGLGGRLVPLLLEKIRPPLGFRQLQAADLTEWDGTASHEDFIRLSASIRAICPVSRSPTAGTTASDAPFPWTGRKFEADLYLSYASLDNAPLVEGSRGWVANFCRAVEIKLSQIMGRQVKILWQPTLDEKVAVEPTLEEIRQVVAFISVVSPRYVRSGWARRELSEFCSTARSQGGVSAQGVSRIFKVLKTPVLTDMQPSELQSLFGYEFFSIDAETGRIHEFNEVFGPKAQMDFWTQLDHLAQDLALLLERSRLDSISDASTSVSP